IVGLWWCGGQSNTGIGWEVDRLTNTEFTSDTNTVISTIHWHCNNYADWEGVNISG
ncbi:unnamed protein product, partial [Staurois parvus]